jgi:predicted HicB family RNase H-like nuclease
MGKGTLHFRLEAEEAEALERAAANDSCSMSSLVRRIVRSWLKERGWLKS